MYKAFLHSHARRVRTRRHRRQFRRSLSLHFTSLTRRASQPYPDSPGITVETGSCSDISNDINVSLPEKAQLDRSVAGLRSGYVSRNG